MKRTIRSLVVVSMLIAIALPVKVAAQENCCFTQEQVDAAKRSRQKLKIERDKAQQTADSLNKVLMQLDSVPAGSQIMQNQDGNITITITNTLPSADVSKSNGVRKVSASESFDTTIQRFTSQRTIPITLSLGLIGGSGIGGDARIGYGNSFVDYRGFYGNQPNIYHRGSLGFISGQTDSKYRFLVGLSGSVKLVEELVTASSNVETGNINLGDEIIVTTDVTGSFWTPQHYHMGLFSGVQANLGEHFWIEGIINPMFRISEKGDFNFNCDLRCGYRLNKNIFFGGLTYFNQISAFTVGSSITF
jgi:hypothetical protein